MKLTNIKYYLNLKQWLIGVTYGTTMPMMPIWIINISLGPINLELTRDLTKAPN